MYTLKCQVKTQALKPGGGRGIHCEHTRCSCEVQQEHVVPASDATLAACSASLAHALQELWRARVWGCSLCLAGSDPFTISIMSGPQKIAHG